MKVAGDKIKRKAKQKLYMKIKDKYKSVDPSKLLLVTTLENEVLQEVAQTMTNQTKILNQIAQNTLMTM